GMKRSKLNIRPFNDKARPQFKFMINYREAGKRRRTFFKTEAAAKSWVKWKNGEYDKQGREHAEFPSNLRVMAQECADLLSGHGKTIRNATDFLIAHLKASERSCTAAALVKELVAAKKADGLSERHVEDLGRLNRFADHFDGKQVATITSAEIDDWLRDLV